MTAGLDRLGVEAMAHPLAVDLAVLALVWTVGRARGVRPRLEPRHGAPARLSVGLAGTVLAAYVAVVSYDVVQPQYFDAAEPTMPSVGWAAVHGEPIYHSIESAARYSHIYGPLAFLAQGWALLAFGPSLLVSKLVGAVFALASLAVTWAALRTETTARRASVLTALVALVFLEFRDYSFWTRPEPLQIACVAVMLLAALRGGRLVSPVVFGLTLGVMTNLKITGPVYALAPFVILVQRQGRRSALLAAACAAVSVALPFVALRGVSLSAYLDWFLLSAHGGLVAESLRTNLEWAVFLLAPVALAIASSGRVHRSEGTLAGVRLADWALAVSTAIVAVAASKPGSGPYHFLPLLPLMASAAAAAVGRGEWTLRRAPVLAAARAAFVIVAATTAVLQTSQFVRVMNGRRSLDARADIAAILARYHGVVEMGYGTTDVITFQRPLLVFHDNTYFLDEPAVGEHQRAGVSIPPSTIDAIARCRVNYWLLPKGEKPFAAVNFYAAVRGQPLFPEAFRQAFLRADEKVASSRFFDIWQCHPTPAAGVGRF